jgi:co-chaperonin GroES (HSP10)
MLQPIKDRVLIERDEKKTQTSSGLVIPDAAQDTEVTGVIIALGTDVEENLACGQKVLFGKHDGVTVESKYIGRSGDFILVRDGMIRAILETDEEKRN